MRRSDREERLREELALHIQLATEANIRNGMAPDEARRAARIAFGPAEHFKDEARDEFRSAWLAALVQDVLYAWRGARRAPLLTMVAIVTLAVAFGLTTSAFTAVNAVFFRALPYPEPERLALIWGTVRGKTDRLPVSFTNAMDWRRDTKSLASLAAFSCWPRPILTIRGEPARVSMMGVSADFFRTLEVRPLLGRLFDSTDFATENLSAVVLTHPLWRDRFEQDSAVVGRRVMLDGAPVTVIGVLPSTYTTLATTLGCRPDLYRPLDSRYDDTQRAWTFLKVVARLRPVATLQQAQAELDVENSRLAERFPAANGDHAAIIVSMSEYLTRPLRPTLAFAQIAALLVLVIAGANVASLLLARATVRRREFAVRIALGASRGRLSSQILTECLLLGVASGALGTLLALVAAGVLNRVGGDALPDPRGVFLDWHLIAFASVMTLLVTMILGFTAVTTSGGEGLAVLSSLRDGGRGGTPPRSRARSVIVAGQLALAMIVLVGAGLLARSYRRVLAVHPGFDPAGVLTARVMLPEARYPRGPRQVLFFQQVLNRISAQHGVIAAGAVSILPESPNFDHTNVKVPGRQYAAGEEPIPDVYRVTPGYFEGLRIPLVRGRFFAASDDDRHTLVAIINETMARTLFPGESALGRRLWTGAGVAERTIVGVVGDVYQYGLESAKTMQLYVPHADNAGGDLTIVVRAANGGTGLPAVVREAVHATDPGVPVDELLTMDQVLAASTARRRLLAGLSLTFALGAIGLASIGLYGVLAYSVARRRQEIGVRMALGATAKRIVLGVLTDASRIVVPALVVGWLLAVALVRLMAPLIFGVSLSDNVTLALAPATMALMAVLASAVPAVRATRLSPAIVLRED